MLTKLPRSMLMSHTHGKLIGKITNLLDVLVIFLLILLLIGFLAFDYELLGFQNQIIPIPHGTEYYFELTAWVLFGILILDLYLKYKMIGSWKLFFTKKWLDVLTTILIPILFPLKFTITFAKFYKFIKSSKYGFKLAQKMRKLFF